jgi:hypothetical protein
MRMQRMKIVIDIDKEEYEDYRALFLEKYGSVVDIPEDVKDISYMSSDEIVDILTSHVIIHADN